MRTKDINRLLLVKLIWHELKWGVRSVKLFSQYSCSIYHQINCEFLLLRYWMRSVNSYVAIFGTILENPNSQTG